MPHELRRFADKKLSANGFSFHAPAFRGALFTQPDTGLAVLLDHRICDTRYPFAYTLYTKEQNSLMNQYRGVFRFMADTRDDLAAAALTLDRLLHSDRFEDDIHAAGRHRQWHDIDPTLPEASFEQAFIDCYGRQALEHVIREFPVIDINGHTRWVDYYIRRHSFDLAIEKNGETWHHPQVIGRKRYQDQLIKQNSLVAYGTKVFRWSLEGMTSTDNFLDEMRLFFGNPHDFLSARKLTLSRPFSLFKHQATVLEDIQAERAGGKTAFLVVLPTGTGKTEILIADHAREYRAGNAARTLVMVPTRQLKTDHTAKFASRLSDHGLPQTLSIGEDPARHDITIQTYAWMSRHYTRFDSRAFDYIAVDEAHHAVAPTVQKVIQSSIIK